MQKDNICVCCGKIIPEGRHVCLRCGSYDDMQTFRAERHPELITPAQMHYCGAIIGHYGKDAQKIQAVQELSELICVLTRRKDQQGEHYQSELLDELADSIIMIEQMRRAHDITLEMLHAKIEEKTDRQLRRMSREKWNADDAVLGLGKGKKDADTETK